MNEFYRRLYDIVGRNSYIASFADPNREILDIDNYSYSVENSAATPINNVTVRAFDIPMDTDSDFVFTYISGAAVLNGETTLTLNPAILLQIFDQSSGRNYFNAPVPMGIIAGYAGFPFLLTSPRVVRARTTLTVTAIAAQNVIFNTFALSFGGSRIFYK